MRDGANGAAVAPSRVTDSLLNDFPLMAEFSFIYQELERLEDLKISAGCLDLFSTNNRALSYSRLSK